MNNYDKSYYFHLDAKPPLGSGERFEKLVQDLMAKGNDRASAERLAAWIGRKKYGKAKFQKMSSAGKK